jgi:hypothetical protein
VPDKLRIKSRPFSCLLMRVKDKRAFCFKAQVSIWPLFFSLFHLSRCSKDVYFRLVSVYLQVNLHQESIEQSVKSYKNNTIHKKPCVVNTTCIFVPYRPVEREKENMSGLRIATLNRNTTVREGQMGLFSRTIKNNKGRDH